jgi:hypothetical protein
MEENLQYYNKKLSELSNIISKSSKKDTYIIPEFEILKLDFNKEFVKNNSNVFKEFYYDNDIVRISESVSYNFAIYLWRAIKYGSYNIVEYFNLIDEVINFINSETILKYYIFSPFDQNLTDYFFSVGGLGFLFETENDKFYSVVVTEMD